METHRVFNAFRGEGSTIGDITPLKKFEPQEILDHRRVV